MNEVLLTALAHAAREFAKAVDGLVEYDPKLEAKAEQTSGAAPEPQVQPISVAQMFPTTAPQASPVATPVSSVQPHVAMPVVQPDLTLTQVQEVVGGYIKDLDETRQNQILQLIQSYGVDRVSSLPPEVYSEFLVKAKEIASV